MNMNQIINMITRILMRKMVNKGVNAGINAASGKVRKRPQAPAAMDESGTVNRQGTPPKQQTAEQRQGQMAARQARRARRAARAARQASKS